jgi:type VI protein secretion system component Hcp
MSDMVLSVPGIRGNAGARGHFGDIDLSSYSSEWRRPGQLMVTKGFDDASTKLQAAVLSGKQFGAIRLSQNWAEGGGFHATFNFAAITAYSSSAGAESLWFDYQTCWIQYFE